MLITKRTPDERNRLIDGDDDNGIARRSWARNPEAIFAIKRGMGRTPGLKVTLPNIVEDGLIEGVLGE